MRRYIAFILLLSHSYQFSAQGVWTWVSGDPTNPWPVTGTQGVYSSTNQPGTGYAGACWTTDSVFWRFGSNGDDLWKYNPSINQWAIIKGAVAGNFPTYGTQGVGAAGNTPGSAAFGHPHWIGNNGNLWLYGNNSSSDMWQFDPVTSNWIWMSGGMGTLPASYGTQGVPSSSNTPGNINEVDCKWVSSNGNLWLFNDIDGTLWQYDVGLNEWIWMKGTPGSFTPVYGTIGTYNASAEPAIVVSCPNTGNSWCYWHYNGEFWMYINRSFTETELWKYSPMLNQWACMRIDTITSGPVYGTQCIEASSNMPETREETRARWVDDCGHLWLFGGMDYCGGTSYNDMWRLNAGTLNWTWIGGGSIAGNLGSIGVSSTSNWPHATCGSFHWLNETGFWLNGGETSTQPTQIMWLYEPDSVIADFDYAIDSTCTPPGLVEFTDLSTTGCNNIKSYSWDFGDSLSGSLNSDTVPNPQHIYALPGTYQVTLVVQNCTFDADTISKTLNIPVCNVKVSLDSDTICAGSCIDLTAIVSGGQSPFTFQWDNGITNNTAGPINVCPTSTTSYTVIVIDSLGNSDTTTAQILVNPSPTVNLGNDTVLCSGSILLDAGNGANLYVWNDGSTSQTMTVSQSGNYWVDGYLGDCIDSDTIHVAFISEVLTLNDTLLCTGDTLDVNVPDSVIWNTGDTGSIRISQNGTYLGSFITGNCTYSDTMEVTFYDPIAQFIANDTAGCPPLLVSFTDQSTTPYGTITTWKWNFGDGNNSLLSNPQHTYLNPGIYDIQLFIETNHSCSDSTIVTNYIEVYPEPYAAFIVDPETPELSTDVIHFIDQSTGAVSWFWDFGDGSTSTDQNPDHKYNTFGAFTITLTVTNQFGCTSSISFLLEIESVLHLYVPNSFTPNGDGVNDIFLAVGAGILEFELMIFDRWGELIFLSDDITKGWDGTINGYSAKSDVYVWKIKLRSENNTYRSLTGHINLIR